MATAKAAKEPSMEDILASIKQIIADDDQPASEAKQEAPEMTQGGDQAAIDDVFASIDVNADDGGEEMAVDDIDSLFDDPVPAEPAEEEPDDEEDDEDDEDVLALTADQTVEEAMPAEDMNDAVAEFDETMADDDISFDSIPDEITVELATEMAPPPPEPVIEPSKPVVDEVALMSSDAAASVRSSFGALDAAMTMSSNMTVEGLMREMMRPMLKAWLDENLPAMVEQMVRAEIERMRNS